MAWQQAVPHTRIRRVNCDLGSPLPPTAAEARPQLCALHGCTSGMFLIRAEKYK